MIRREIIPCSLSFDIMITNLLPFFAYREACSIEERENTRFWYTKCRHIEACDSQCVRLRLFNFP